MSNEELRKGLEYGFIDDSVIASENCSPKLLINDHARKEKILSAISAELYDCDEFMFSVAFITESGVSALLNELRFLEKEGIKGKIIASQYQNFTQPKALRKLTSFSNIDLRIITEESKMHTKGYIFRKGEKYNMIIGCSNLTSGALCSNEEWNLKVSSARGGAIIRDLIEEFDSIFRRATPIDEIWIGQYSEIYDTESRFQRQLRSGSYAELEKIVSEPRINPNTMQKNALESLDALRGEGKTRALLISATGTGKTYLSAFDAKKFNPERLLFVAHRESILKKSMESYQRVFGTGTSMGLLTGNRKDYDADFIFASIQTLSQDYILDRLDPAGFDYIVIDEVHHGGASTYRKVMDHFRPEFLLGMTATPERNDSFDVFGMFDHNIAYEIRLQQAMEFNMICPFHYFGIDDIKVNGEALDSKADFARLTSDERVRHITDNAGYYGYCGKRVKGLVFCKGTDEAKELSRKFNRAGYRTEALTSESGQEVRDDAVMRLESDGLDCLDYIFVFDLFNEGVDIPSVNQIIMLRPTKSPIVFIQQLGRGLRKYEGKEYVVVIDFIGNYDSNYMIPVALSGDRSYNKDNVRRFVVEGNREIPGNSVISLESITKGRIYESIDRMNLSELKIVRNAYDLLKKKLGVIPDLSDFDRFGSMDALKFTEMPRFGSYHDFLVDHDKEYLIRFTDPESECIRFLSYVLCSGKRMHEVEFTDILMEGEPGDVLKRFRERMSDRHGIHIDGNAETNIINIMSGGFFENYRDCILIERCDGIHRVSKSFESMIKNPQFRKIVRDMMNLGIKNHGERYSDRCEGTDLTLYRKYTYSDVCRLLNWPKNLNGGVIGGYYFDKKTNTLPVFINYVKGSDVAESQRYEDHFLNPSVLVAAPKSTDGRYSSRVVHIENMEEENIVMPLFVRKNKNDKGPKEFYYLGNTMFERISEAEGSFMIVYNLKNAVRQDIYDYLLSSIEDQGSRRSIGQSSDNTEFDS